MAMMRIEVAMMRMELAMMKNSSGDDDDSATIVVEEDVDQVNCCVKNGHGLSPVQMFDSKVYSRTIPKEVVTKMITNRDR